jgi:hypothetical protein
MSRVQLYPRAAFEMQDRTHAEHVRTSAHRPGSGTESTK